VRTGEVAVPVSSDDRTDHWRTSMTAKFLEDESGATMIEYGLIAAMISIAAISILTLVGDGLVGIFQKVSDVLTTAAA